MRWRLATRDELGEVWLEDVALDGTTVFGDDEGRALELTWAAAVALLWYLQASPTVYLASVANESN